MGLDIMEKTKLTKAVIIEHLHDKLGINRNDIHQIVDEFFEEVKDGLKDEKVIELRGFGTFEVRTRKGREKARNPKTGEPMKIPARTKVKFRVAKAAKDAVLG